MFGMFMFKCDHIQFESLLVWILMWVLGKSNGLYILLKWSSQLESFLIVKFLIWLILFYEEVLIFLAVTSYPSMQKIKSVCSCVEEEPYESLSVDPVFW